MACSLTQLRTDYDSLQRAVHAGVMNSSVDGQSVSFNSLRDMRSVLADISRQIDILESSDQTKPRVSSFTMTRGV